MIEKFGYFITRHNTIRIYRIMGNYVMNTVSGVKEWKTDLTSVAWSYNYEVRNNIGADKAAYNLLGNKKILYDTRAEAEQAARQELECHILSIIKNYKKMIEGLDENLLNMKVKYFNCGGK